MIFSPSVIVLYYEMSGGLNSGTSSACTRAYTKIQIASLRSLDRLECTLECTPGLLLAVVHSHRGTQKLEGAIAKVWDALPTQRELGVIHLT